MSSPRVSGIPSLPPLRRRGLFALGGAGLAAGLLAGCGEELPEPSTEGDAELLGDALVAEENTVSALRGAAGAGGTAAIAALSAQASEAANRVQAAISELDVKPGDGGFEGGAGAGAKALRAASDHTNAAIAAHRLGTAQLSSTELRRQAFELATLAGARLAILEGLLGGEQAASPFVTGGSEEPFVDPDTPENAAEAGS